MTHPNSVTNGASLEDCHTNFFALADLCGIKWKRLTCDITSCQDPVLEDPVLNSYYKCLAADLLCVWRRIDNLRTSLDANRRTTVDNQLCYIKELWIFWYGEDPGLSDLVSAELTEIEQGSWETGLSYECRTLLFKALHNLIERCLLSRGFSRFGRWFIQTSESPSEKQNEDESNKSSGKTNGDSGAQLTFAFNFFVHGDSTVCASVDVRQHSPIYRITNLDLNASNGFNCNTKVILAPYGLAGILTGQTFKETDPSVQSMLSEWKQIYPNIQTSSSVTSSKEASQLCPQQSSFPHNFNNEIGSDYAYGAASGVSVVEVIVSGFRMKYPLCFVFCTDEELQKSKELGSNKRSASPSSSKTINNHNMCANVSSNAHISEHESNINSVPELKQLSSHEKSVNPTYLIKNAMSQDLTILLQSSKNNNETVPDDANPLWNISDPCCKQNCNCFRCKTKRGALSKSSNSNVSNASQNSSHKKGDKLDKSQQKASKPSAPFHRRSPIFDTVIDISNSVSTHQSANVSIASTNAPSVVTNTSVSSNLSQPTSVPTYSYKSPISGGGLPSLPSNATTPTANGIDSPRSVAPSLNLEGAVSSIDQTNLSLSPHPSKEDATAAACIESQMANQTVAQSPVNGQKERTHLEQLLSPNHSLPSVKSAPINIQMPEDSPSVMYNQWTPGGGQSNSETEAFPVNSVNANPVTNGSACPNPATNGQSQPNSGVKRPFLTISSYEEMDCDSIRNGLLYDYRHLHELSNWDIPPLKNRRIKYNYDDIRRSSVNELSNGRKKNSPVTVINGDIIEILTKPKDPYEFNDIDEDGPSIRIHNVISEDVIHSSGNNRTEYNVPNGTDAVAITCQSKDTPKPNLMPSEITAASPQATRGFTREDELVASYSDLDQIFDTSSGEDSDDELFPAPSTPSGTSNRVANSSTIIGVPSDDHPKSNKNGTGTSGSIFGVAELARMFPTPPSLEPMAPSPCNNYCGPDATVIDDMNGKCDIYPCSPANLDSKDWSYVYKPPIQSVAISSSKYAPLKDITSLPPVSLPSQCIYKHSSVVSPPRHSEQLTSQPIQQQFLSRPKVPKGLPLGYNHILPQTQHMPSVNTCNFYPQHAMQMPRGPVSASPQPPQYSQINGIGNRMRPNVSSLPPHQMHSNYHISSQTMANNFQHPHQPQQITQHPHHVHQQGSFMAVDGLHTQGMSNYPNYVAENNSMANQSFLPPYPNQRSAPYLPQSNNFSAAPFGVKSQPNAFLGRNNVNDINAVPETHSLMVNLILSDSMLNLFKDHNFESCSICVCNMNIKGSDVGMYLPDSMVSGGSDEAQYKCTCSFSAVTNRHRSHFAGLFYEDEIECTGVIYDPCEGLRKKSLTAIGCSNTNETKEIKDSTNDSDNIDSQLIDLLTIQCSNIFPSCSVLSKSIEIEILNERQNNLSVDSTLNSLSLTFKNIVSRNPMALSYRDGCEVTLNALISAKLAHNIPDKLLFQHINEEGTPLHEWAYKRTKLHVNNQETVRLLKQLQPLMQESVQRKLTKMWEVTYSVSGPLTWRQFHRLAGRGTEDQCEPQPIPSLLVGYDKDWVALSPFALKYWEKLLLEPYSVTRDIAYIVVSPDNPYIVSNVKTFFKELSTTYEMLRLGRHCPIAKVLRDGIMRVKKKIEDEPIDEWFNQIGDGLVATKLKMYAQVCRYYLAPLLKTQSLDKSIFDSNQTKQSNDSTNGGNCNNTNPTNGNTISNKPPGTSPLPHDSTHSDKTDENQNDSPNHYSNLHQNQQHQDADVDENPHKQPAIVIYIVEPFTYGSMDKDTYRLSSMGLLRCYSQMLRFLPENLQNSIHLQLVSLDSILCNGSDAKDTTRQDQLKELSFSVFAQCRQLMVHQSTVKSLTGFGPAAIYDLFLKSKDPSSNISRIFMPPYILAPLKDKQTELGEMFGDRKEKSQILFCSYCLTEDQRWLLASCTNDKGDMLETTCINIEIPNRTRRRKACVRKFGLDKLMRFIHTLISDSVQPWRLIIGRLGRVGHLELKEWSLLLSKKSLIRYTRQLKDSCGQCSVMTPLDQPAIFSTCLISLEADTVLRVFPEQYTPDDRFSSSCNTCSLSTPEDASCTHILVFPTSATTQSSSVNFSMDNLENPIGDDELFQALDDPDLRVEDDIDVNDILQWTENPPASPGLGSPRRDGLNHPDSPSIRHSGYCGSGSMKVSNGGDIQEEPTQLLQQPLALGFYVSTAQTGPLPRWFWSSCPHLESSCPVFLKSALLIHTPSVQQNSDDLLHSNIRNYHPLDSNLTTDVLRYALEGYNGLSWLSLDPSTHDRTSCLPIHIQRLTQLYHTVHALI